MAAWSGALQARRAARPSTSSGATFLDTMLQQLGLARAYPFANYTVRGAGVVNGSCRTVGLAAGSLWGSSWLAPAR
jgi:hypothetical protein